MNGNLIVGATIVLLIATSAGYILYQRRKGIGSCGCKCCGCCNRCAKIETSDICPCKK